MLKIGHRPVIPRVRFSVPPAIIGQDLIARVAEIFIRNAYPLSTIDVKNGIARIGVFPYQLEEVPRICADRECTDTDLGLVDVIESDLVVGLQIQPDDGVADT